MTEVVAALIWDGEKFLICQRPEHKARGLLEHNAVAWVTPDEIPHYAFCPADKEINERIAAEYGHHE